MIFPVPLFFIGIVIVAVAIIIYFAFPSKSVAPDSAELLDETPEDSAIEASVADKQVAPSGIKRDHYLMHAIKFDCADGVVRELSVTPKLFKEIQIGERETLVYRNNMFIGFGSHGSIEIDSDMPDADGLIGFTYDDFDESIDVEQEHDSAGVMSYDNETRELMSKFENYEKLPAKSETVEDETDNLKSYSPDKIFSKLTLYPFLQRENEVRRMFARTYDEAMQDLLGFDGNSRKGLSADSVFVNKNEIRVVVTLQEAPAPLKSRITAELGVNE